MKTQLVCLLLCLGFTQITFATHNRAGEITYEQRGPLSIRAFIKTYSKASSRAADRDSLEICWGDGTCQWVLRTNGLDTFPFNGIPDGELLGNDVKFNLYVIEYTYLATGEYTLSMKDPYRNGGILNVNFPNSDLIPFFLFTKVKLENGLTNSSPIPTMPPIDQGFTGLPFFHTPNAYDPDGDSLAYQLIIPLQDTNTNVPNYRFPNEIVQTPNNQIALDPVTGIFTWLTPQQAGEYNIAFLIKEYRNGELIGEMVRDMQIVIEEDEGFMPPNFEQPGDSIVQIRDTESFSITYRASNERPIRLSAYGGPFLAPNPAVWTADTAFATIGTTTGNFFWQPTPAESSVSPYYVIIKAETIDRVIDIRLLEIRVDLTVNTQTVTRSPAHLSIFPNPTQDQFRLNLNGKTLNHPGHLRLYGQAGQLLWERPAQRGDQAWDIDTAQLPTGVYYLRLTSKGLMLEEKMVKQ